jgi:hypothetical protein
MLDWATQVAKAMTEASFWVDYETELAATERKQGQFRLSTKLSALIDCGRWYFPNFNADSLGPEKELAYRGVRQLALSAILSVFDALEPAPNETGEQRTQHRESIVDAKRIFVSEVQAALLNVSQAPGK